MINEYPDFQPVFNERHGRVSLSFALFLQSPPEVALRMMKEGVISDLNELSEKGVSLLALKTKHSYHTDSSGSTGPPSWDNWARHPEELWEGLNPANSQTLAAAMIFAGADPWVSWAPEQHDKINSCLFSQTCYQNNAPLVKFLLSHPQCPDLNYFENIRLHQVDLKGEVDYRGINSDWSLMHYVAWSGKVDIMKELISKKLDINVVDEFGRTPIFYVRSLEMLKLLVEHGANVNHRVGGYGVAEFWKKWISTSAKTAEFNKVIIEKLKENMSPDELRVLQKPVLLQEILKGTKTSFEAVYRKSKFTPDLVFDKGERGQWSVITAALLRSDDKANVFLRWAIDKKIDFNRLIWEDMPYSDSDLGFVLYSRGYGTQSLPVGAPEALREKYNGFRLQSDQQEFWGNYVGLLHQMGKTSFRSKTCLTQLVYWMIKEAGPNPLTPENTPHYYQQKMDSIAQTLVGNRSVLISQLPQFQSALDVNLLSVVASASKKNQLESNSFGSNLGAGQMVEFLSLVRNKTQNDPTSPWAKTMLLAVVASYLVEATATNYNGTKSDLQKSRDSALEFLSGVEQSLVSSTELDTIKGVLSLVAETKKNDVSPVVSMLERGMLQEALTNQPSLGSSAPRRRM